jgi:hypothetical protein
LLDGGLVADEYRIRPVGAKFEIIDQAGNRIGMCNTRRKAKKEIAVCASNELMWSARMLVKISVNAFMNMRNVDSRTPQYWIREAAD